MKNGPENGIAILKTENRPDVNCKLTGAYIKNGEYSKALQELSDHSCTCNFCTLQKTILELNQRLDGCFAIKSDSVSRERVKIIAESGEGYGCRNAQALLEQVFGQEFPEILELPVSHLAMRTAENYSATNTNKNISLKNYPNPFTSETKVEAVIPENIKNPVLRITDFAGREIHSFGLKAGENTIKITSDMLKPGVYFYGIYSGPMIISTSKMIYLGH